jgi:hypothetical protein
MIAKEFVIHRADINNHCPNCFSARGMVFSFIQYQKENSWLIKTSAEIQEQLFCQHCSQEIYPGSWDDAIERVYAYQKKCFTPMPAGIKLKKKGKIVLAIALSAIISGTLIWLYAI